MGSSGGFSGAALRIHNPRSGRCGQMRRAATRACSRSASIVARARIVMSFAQDADKLFNRVHVVRRFAPLARFRTYAVSIPWQWALSLRAIRAGI